MYRLYWTRATGAFAPEAVMAELGLSPTRVEIDTDKDEQHAPDFLAVNPRGQVPALVLPDGTVMTESAAMLLHLADCHPQARLLPEPASRERALVYRWLFFAAQNLYEADLREAYSERYTADPAGIAAVRRQAEADLDAHWALVETALDEGPFLLGRRFSVIDPYLAMLAAWYRDPPALFARCPAVGRLVAAVSARPAIAPLWQEHFGHKPAFAG